MVKNLNRSQSAHKRLGRISYEKSLRANTSSKKNFYNAKIDYHNEVYNRQDIRGKTLLHGERTFLYHYFMRKYGISKSER